MDAESSSKRSSPQHRHLAFAATVVGIAFCLRGGCLLSLNGIDGNRSPPYDLQVIRLDLNHCNARELAVLPEVGPALADRILRYREEEGPFKNIDQLLEVKGIGVKRLGPLREFLYIADQ
jgi:competence ComEA-like helix-hairpin-helix protein